MPAVHARPAIQEDLGGEARVTPLELCFDLVFVLAITQVTGMISDDPSWAGLARGLLVLAVLWWCWAAYACLTDTVDPDQSAARLVVFVAVAALLVVSAFDGAAQAAFCCAAIAVAMGWPLISGRQRLVVAAALLAFVPAATALPALASLSIVFARCAGLIAYEAIWLADARRRVRQAA